MATYNPVPRETLQQMAPEWQKVLAAIANLANRHIGRPDDPPEGIFRAEGGVKVNGCRIRILHSGVVDADLSHVGRAKATKEEAAVAKAINEVVCLYKTGKRTAIEAAAKNHDCMVLGNGLPDFFGEFWEG